MKVATLVFALCVLACSAQDYSSCWLARGAMDSKSWKNDFFGCYAEPFFKECQVGVIRFLQLSTDVYTSGRSNTDQGKLDIELYKNEVFSLRQGSKIRASDFTCTNLCNDSLNNLSCCATNFSGNNGTSTAKDCFDFLGGKYDNCYQECVIEFEGYWGSLSKSIKLHMWQFHVGILNWIWRYFYVSRNSHCNIWQFESEKSGYYIGQTEMHLKPYRIICSCSECYRLRHVKTECIVLAWLIWNSDIFLFLWRVLGHLFCEAKEQYFSVHSIMNTEQCTVDYLRKARLHECSIKQVRKECLYINFQVSKIDFTNHMFLRPPRNKINLL